MLNFILVLFQLQSGIEAPAPLRHADATYTVSKVWRELKNNEITEQSLKICQQTFKVPVFDLREQQFQLPTDVLATCDAELIAKTGDQIYKTKIQLGGFITLEKQNGLENKSFGPWAYVLPTGTNNWILHSRVRTMGLQTNELVMLLDGQREYFYQDEKIMIDVHLKDNP